MRKSIFRVLVALESLTAQAERNARKDAEWRPGVTFYADKARWRRVIISDITSAVEAGGLRPLWAVLGRLQEQSQQGTDMPLRSAARMAEALLRPALVAEAVTEAAGPHVVVPAEEAVPPKAWVLRGDAGEVARIRFLLHNEDKGWW